MKYFAVSFLVFLFFFSFSIPTKQASSEIPNSIIDRTAVQIESLIVFDKNREITTSTGSGVIVNSDDHGSIILTNRHICDLSANEIMAKINNPTIMFKKEAKTIDGKKYPVGIIKKSNEHDLCLVHAGDLRNTKYVRLAEKAPKPRQPVFASGYPGGVWVGAPVILSGLIVNAAKFRGISSYIISVPVVPGMSGAPLLNKDGELVGLVWGFVPHAHMLGLAVPHEHVKTFLSLGN